MDSSWVIYGAPDLQINTITRPWKNSFCGGFCVLHWCILRPLNFQIPKLMPCLRQSRNCILPKLHLPNHHECHWIEQHPWPSNETFGTSFAVSGHQFKVSHSADRWTGNKAINFSPPNPNAHKQAGRNRSACFVFKTLNNGSNRHCKLARQHHFQSHYNGA